MQAGHFFFLFVSCCLVWFGCMSFFVLSVCFRSSFMMLCEHLFFSGQITLCLTTRSVCTQSLGVRHVLLLVRYICSMLTTSLFTFSSHSFAAILNWGKLMLCTCTKMSMSFSKQHMILYGVGNVQYTVHVIMLLQIPGKNDKIYIQFPEHLLALETIQG